MKTLRILWIEDDTKILMGLVRPLEKDGHKIIIAEDEKEALKLINQSDFDLILFDIIIPTGIKGDKGDYTLVGMRLLDTLLTKMKIKTPIIVLSIVRDEKKIDEMYNMGVKKVLAKGAYLPSHLKKEVYTTLGIEE